MIRQVAIGPYALTADDSNLTSRKVLENGLNYERHIRLELERLLPDCSGFLDIGANVGLHTLSAASINPKLWIDSFEGSSANAAYLAQNVAANGIQAIVFPFPLAQRTGVLRCNLDRDNTVFFDLASAPEDAPLYAAAFHLDALAQLLQPFQLIKIDVEGFEVAVLKGAGRLLAAHRPNIIFEFCPEVAYRSRVTPVGMLQWFLDYHYRLTTLDYIPGMRATFTNAQACLDHIKSTSKWICDILAEPI